MSSHILSGRRLLAFAGVAMLAIAAVLAVMAMSAGATSNTIGVKSAKVGAKRESIAVNSKGVAVYTLSGDSKQHMECTKGNGCFSAWPPVTVKGRVTRAAGVKGKLGTLERSGITQVTLNGHPLYTFAGDDNQPGVANGNGLTSFGGTWHVVAARNAKAASAPAPMPGSGGGW